MSSLIRKVMCVALFAITLLTGPLVAAAEEEPDIRIRYGKDSTYYEYRVKGELVEIKVVPKIGPAYYLVPAEGGEFRRTENSRFVAPSWKLIEW